MPIPGGVYALQQSLSFYPAGHRDSRRRSNSLSPAPPCHHEDDSKYEEYKRAQKHFSENLKVTMSFYQGMIPSTLNNLTGALVLEAKKEIVHSGMFILLKGLSIPPKRPRLRATGTVGGGSSKKQVTSLKFTILGHVSGQDEEIVVEAGSKETYPLELELPQSWEDLPQPIATSDGKLHYHLQAFMTTSKGRHVKVGETYLQYQGYYDLRVNSEETQKPIRIDQHVQSKRSYLGLGRKKTVDMELSVEKRGFLPQEHINFLVIGRGHDNKTVVQLECKVELLQKVWYQVMSNVGKRMSVKMKVNLIAFTSANRLLVEPGKEVVWEGSLQIPPDLTPTYKFDFMNSISYTLRASFALNGDKEGKVTGEAPVYIGTGSGIEENKMEGGGYGVSGAGPYCRPTISVDEEEDDNSPSRFDAGVPLRPSQSMSFAPTRGRAGSMSSVESFHSRVSGASASSSLFRMPPSYSQLSSRRPSRETLPPAYCELELQEKCTIRESQEDGNDDQCGVGNCNEDENETTNPIQESSVDAADLRQ